MAKLKPLKLLLVAEDKLSPKLFTIGKRLDTFGQQARRTGRTLTTYVSAPLAAAGIAAGKLASDFDDSMQRIVGLVGLAAEEVAGMREEVFAISKETGRGPRELGEALYFVVSAGLSGQDALDVLRASAQAATAGLGETGAIADAVSSALNAYGAENLSAGEAVGILVAAVREGKAEATDFNAVIGDVIPLASKLGVTFDQVAASLAAQTVTGTDAATAGTNLTAVLSALISPGTQAEKVMRHFGLSSAGLTKQLREKGLVSVLETLDGATRGNVQAMAAMIPNIRALRAIFAQTGEAAAVTRNIFKEVAAATEDDLAKAFQAALPLVSVKFNRGLAAVSVAGIKLGEKVLPLVAKGMDWLAAKVESLTTWFEGLSPTTQKWIGVVVLLAGVLGPALAGLGFMATGITALIAVGGLLSGVFTTISAGAWVMAGIFATIASGIAIAWQPIVDTFMMVKNLIETISTRGGGLLDRWFGGGGVAGRDRLAAGAGGAAAGSAPGLARFGLAGAAATSPAAQVGGRLDIHIDSEGRPRVKRLESDSRDFEIRADTGLVMALP